MKKLRLLLGLVSILLIAIGVWRHKFPGFALAPGQELRRQSNVVSAAGSVTAIEPIAGGSGATMANNSMRPAGPASLPVAPIAAFADWLAAWRRADSASRLLQVASGRELAVARRIALKDLIQRDPSFALEAAVPVGLRSELPAEVLEHLEEWIDAQGSLEVAIGCFGTVTRIERAAIINGRRYEAFTFGRRAEQTTKFGVPLHGIAIDELMAVAERPYRRLDDGEKAARGLAGDVLAVMVGGRLMTFVDSVELERLEAQLIGAEARTGPYVVSNYGGSANSIESPATAANTPWILGEKRVLWVQVDFSDDPGAVATAAEIAATSKQVSEFFASNSQGKTTMAFTILPSVLRLPREKGVYNASSSTVTTLQSDAAVLAKAYDAANGGAGTYDPDRYDRWIVLFKRMPAYTFGGQAQLVGPQVRLNGTISATTAAHELGHTQGLRHAHYWLPSGALGSGPGVHVEYGDIFDNMGGGGVPNGHFGAPEKAQLGYLDADAVATVSVTGTYRVARHDHSEAGAVRGLKLVAGDLGYEYWVEHRQLGPGSFNSAQLDRLRTGVLLHWGPGKAPKFTSGPGSYLIDSTPGSAGGASDAPLHLGEAFTDPDAGLTIKPLAVGGSAPNEYVEVQVSFGAVDGNRNPVLQAELPARDLTARSNIVFSASGSDPDGDPVYFRWDFGDGQIQPNLNNITRRFAQGGDYSLRVSVHDGKGGIAAKTLAFKVSDPLLNWTKRGEGATTSALRSVVFAGGRFVAVGDNSTVLTSRDGFAWTRGTAPAGNLYREVAFNGVRYVTAGIGPSATVRAAAAYSEDGVAWLAGTLPANAGMLNAMTFGAGRFVAVGEAGRIYTSTDGAAWTETSSPVTTALRGIAYADGLFVVSGDAGRLLTSADGLNWDNRSVATANNLAGVTRYNATWVASSATVECFTSVDGVAWTRVATSGRTNNTLRLTSAAGVLLSGTTNGSIAFTEDPRTWSAFRVDSTANATINGVTEGGGLVVVVGSNGSIYTASSPVALSPIIAAPVLHNEADSLKVSVGRKNVLAAGGAGFAKLELYANGTKVSELNASSGALEWTPAAIGSYSLSVRGVTATGESVVSPVVQAVAGMPTWTWCNPSPIGCDLNAAVRARDRWWAVGRAGAFVTIDDDGVISPVDFPTTQQLNGIAHANGRFVVVTNYYDFGAKEEIGSIWTSTDGYDWTPLLTTVFDNFTLYGVAYAAGKWVVVGSGGMLQTSSDGVVWTRQLSGTTSLLRGLTYANNQWVAVGTAGRIITSPDAVRWTDRTSGTTNDLWAVAYTNGSYVAAGLNGTLLRSTDGITWSRVTISSTSHLFHVSVWNDSFVAVGNSGTVLSSADGITWTNVAAEGKFSDFFAASGVGNSGLLVGRGGEIFVSNDGHAGWRRATRGTAESRQAIIYAGGRFVCVGQTTDPVTRTAATPVLFSANGITWTRAANNTAFTANNVSLTSIAYGQQTYVTVSGAGRIYSSADANTWSQRTNPIATGFQAVAAGPSNFVAAGAGGGIISSADGAVWIARQSGSTNTLRGATYGKGRYVIVGDSGTVVTSTDGTSWAAADSGVTASLLAVGYWDAYGFIAVGNNGTMINSVDGVVWQQVETGSSDNLAAITLTPIGLVAAGGTSGSLIASLDGSSWVTATIRSGTTIRGLAASSSAIVAVGDSGNTLAFELRDTTPAPVISVQPAPVATLAGGAVNFSVTARNAVGAVFQWAKDGVPIFGANTPVYTIPAAGPSHAGTYTITVTTPTGSVTSVPARLSFAEATNPGRLVNLSILTELTSRDDTFTFGVVVGGSGTIGNKALLVRAAGPSLAALGVTGVLQDPRLEFYSGATKVGENDNWNGAESVRTMTAQVAAFPFTSEVSRDAALALFGLVSGAHSARISGTGAGTVIAELYDATPSTSFTAATPRLINVSVLKHIGTGLTAGFVIGGSSSRTVLVRAIGPTLGNAPFGVPDVISNPRLNLFSGPTQIGANDDWGGTAVLVTAFSQVGAFPLPASSRDAALVASLQPGSYTVQVGGVGGTTGVALIEVYEVP